MYSSSTITFVHCIAATFFVCLMAMPSRAIDSAELKPLFTNPTRDYSTAPFWVWNDQLTEEQVIDTLNDLAKQNMKQVFVHPRPGLITSYLSEEWFHLWERALSEAQRLDMNLWIYDENSYPSGFAGGWVPEAMPESRGRGLMITPRKDAPRWKKNTLAVFRVDQDRYENVTQEVQAGKTLPKARYYLCSVARAQDQKWFAGKCYVDLLYPGVTEKFIEITFEPYRMKFGEQFGKRIPGIFSDEPLILPTWQGLPWTQNLPQLFQQRWGYNLIDHLICLDQPVGDWKKVRHNFFQLLLEQFIEHWSKPMHDYCEKHNLEWTGHYWEHEWPLPVRVPDNMAMYAWHQRPSIDTLFNQYREDVNAQFGNIRAVKELASVANQLGRKRTLCEAYGAAGWDLRFEDMKRIGDWLYALGVNTLNEHLSYISIRGARKRDYPQSFSYHEPWWEAYHTSASYFARLSAALSQGQQINRILVIEPTTTCWMYYTPAFNNPQVDRVADAFQNMVNACEKAQAEYDIGCEDIMARHGRVAGNAFVIGQRRYTTVVLTPFTENLNERTIEHLETFVKNGGTVMCCSTNPVRVNGSESDRASNLTQYDNWKQVAPDDVPTLLLASTTDGFHIRQNPNDKGLLFHHRRQIDDGQLLFLTNTSLGSPCTGVIETQAGGIEQWVPQTGKVNPYPFERTPQGTRATFELPPTGSLLLFLSKETREPHQAHKETINTIAPAGPPEAKRLNSNVLTLDFVDVTVGDETKTNTYIHDAALFVFNKHGLKTNPWDMATQYRDELISRTFPSDSGFETTYRFTIAQHVPKSLSIVIERADLYAITCNGEAITAAKDTWWLDQSFQRIDITSVAQIGENTITIKASPFTMLHELEAAYLIGDFALEPTDKGFVVIPENKMQLGPWNQQGYPFYGHRVAYTEQFDLPSVSGRYNVHLVDWYGSVAKVTVNGKPAGFIAWQPFECDVTDWIKPGENTVEVVVIGTLKNTLGPHHNNQPLGKVLTTMFQQAPQSGSLPDGNEYATIPYGLFKPFVLKCSVPSASPALQ